MQYPEQRNSMALPPVSTMQSECNCVTITNRKTWYSNYQTPSGRFAQTTHWTEDRTRLACDLCKRLSAAEEAARRASLMEMSTAPRIIQWFSSFYRTDPRYQILRYFNDVAREGTIPANAPPNLLCLLKAFPKADVFTVWRPTSKDSIRNMMCGNATGKGLDIKGKSAKRGNISSYVPFVQIHSDEHKEYVRNYCLKDHKTVRVYYAAREARDEAARILRDVKQFLLLAAEDARRALLSGEDDDEVAADPAEDPAEDREHAMKYLAYAHAPLTALTLNSINTYEPQSYGIDVSEHLFWESYVMAQDTDRLPGTEYDTGRPSEPAFMEDNFKALRKNQKQPQHCHGYDQPTVAISTSSLQPRPVVYQMSTSAPMEPRTLLMAYEENGKVMPVVSDFDCFIMGTRGVKYTDPLPSEQVHRAKGMVNDIGQILDGPVQDAGWTKRWLDVLKQAAVKGKSCPNIPRFGYGDPQSYTIMERAVDRLRDTGCVRHGAECFNYYFPQELDEEFLVISDTLPGKVPWKYVGVAELQRILMDKVKEGFAFPLNPKWILCDPGWKDVYDQLLSSDKPNVQDAVNIWYPPSSGIRDSIANIHARHPQGFQRRKAGNKRSSLNDDGAEKVDVALHELRHFTKRLSNAMAFSNELTKMCQIRTLLSVSSTNDDAADLLEQPQAENRRSSLMRCNGVRLKC